MSRLYPLKFRPIYVEKPWGGRRIASLGRALPGGEAMLIGESWELADLPQARSVVAEGPLAGKTLHEVLASHGPEWLAGVKPEEDGGFPLLVKYLDARENLSVQVHPDRRCARRHGGWRAKSEAVYVLDAAPEAVIYKGLKPGVTPERLVEGARSGRIVDDLLAVPVKSGQCHYLPGGTCHAYGAGVFAVEIQTPSDDTFRVYDWGRGDRALHLDTALECIHFGPPDVARNERRTHVAGIFASMSKICACEDFIIEKVRMVEDYAQDIPYVRPSIWIVLEGEGVISGTPAKIDVPFARGDVLLLPGDMPDAHVRLKADTAWLDVQFPRQLSEIDLARSV